MLMAFSVFAGGDFLITANGKKIEPTRMRIKGSAFHLKMKNKSNVVYAFTEVAAYYDAEEEKYFEKLDLKEKMQFLEVLFTDGRHKVVAHENKVKYAGAEIIFDELYYYDGENMISTFNKKNHMNILLKFDSCTALRKYIRSKKRWFGKLKKLQEFASSFCNIEMI